MIEMKEAQMPSRIFVTGATGNVGSEIVRLLHEKQINTRIGASNVEKAQARFGADADITHFDFLNRETHPPAFEGIERMFLVRPPALSNVHRDIAPAIYAAVDAGVKHIVFLSIQGVEDNRIVPHYKIEQKILSLDLDYTFLRAGFFMQNLSTTHRDEIRDASEIRLPVGKAKTSFIDVRDIAAVAVKCLTEDDHAKKRYTLTGAEALDYDQVAAILSDVLGRDIRYTNPSTLKFFYDKIAQGESITYSFVVTALYTITRFGNAADVTPDVHELLGRAPITFEQFARDHRDVWMNHK